MICKICDFGSARDIQDARQYESKTQVRYVLIPSKLCNRTFQGMAEIAGIFTSDIKGSVVNLVNTRH